MRKLVFLLLIAVATTAACSSSSYKTQGYAKLSNTKDFEEEFPIVWKGIKAAVAEYKLEEDDSEAGRLKTDWIYSTSTEKYLEYTVNNFPRKRYLQTRYKFLITAAKQMGGVKVKVDSDEEVENLKSDGSFDSWKESSDPDASRANEMLRNIELKTLSLPNK